jgi:osmotically inducible lipoprotein OsmB
LAALLCTAATVCSTWTPAEKGTAIGAGAGAVIGNAVTGGSAIGTLSGAAIGGAVGHEAGREEERRNYYYRRSPPPPPPPYYYYRPYP